jgi:hypothetical protein
MQFAFNRQSKQTRASIKFYSPSEIKKFLAGIILNPAPAVVCDSNEGLSPIYRVNMRFRMFIFASPIG